MIYIKTEDKQVGEFGSVEDLGFFQKIADDLNLKYLQELLINGFTINIKETIVDIEQVKWPTVDGYDKIASGLVDALMRCKGIVFLE